MQYKEFKTTSQSTAQSDAAASSSDTAKSDKQGGKQRTTKRASSAAKTQTLAQMRIQHLQDKVKHAKAELEAEIAAQRLALSNKQREQKRRALQRQRLQAVQAPKREQD
jgi:hypothetical protein